MDEIRRHGSSVRRSGRGSQLEQLGLVGFDRKTNARSGTAPAPQSASLVARAYAPLPAPTLPDTAGRLVYAIGDIHGRLDLLRPLLAQIRQDATREPAPDGARPLLILLGDYIDRGRWSAKVLDEAIALMADGAMETRALLGNHEDAMLAYLDGKASGVSFGRYGGRQTLASYGVTAPEADEGAESWAEVRSAFKAAVPSAHVDFLRGLELTITLGNCLFVHAGVRAGVALESQSRRDLLYIREEFLEAPVDCGRFIVHGHTPEDEPYGAPGRLCVDTGAYASGKLTAVRLDGRPPRMLQADHPEAI